MHHEQGFAGQGVRSCQRLLAQPIEQGRVVRRFENVGQGVALEGLRAPCAAASKCRSWLPSKA